MRLLLDEMYPPAIAERLRASGHDVQAVAERAELRAMADDELFALAQRERRAIVTENTADFARIADESDRRGAIHHGTVFVHPAKYRRGQARTIGRMVTALGELLGRTAGEAPQSARWWL